MSLLQKLAFDEKGFKARPISVLPRREKMLTEDRNVAPHLKVLLYVLSFSVIAGVSHAPGND
ncbi:hypothetical protein [Olivibacter sitiensis]|uniref:hypothetical protein n=1 Tax=Olivibacter sitiensis TaxID=376470 RepID=UPI000424600A|nr:hypothetical protein [Olivibacter sitiensis]